MALRKQSRAEPKTRFACATCEFFMKALWFLPAKGRSLPSGWAKIDSRPTRRKPRRSIESDLLPGSRLR